ncbi:hypothetical protein PHLGIDRAFT_27606 [Phlebiopsis gigantea 11061_1 CR5-6]|uniref:N-acetyltransferase domain-containing protein n=1 Tax=Phlebiopsis gigantea (strain 11061_1 CR5-6) TaxID=745531 RepID=A0A0C3SFF4_PHLG1|nr:hypothetical protein PHLGIDRAFT_27606 [Phlebiopsis gigantea 11061_1 CR5-6]
MVDQAKIRPYQPNGDDQRLARFTVAKARMEGLAVANRKTYVDPRFLAVWVALASLLIQYLNWWPNPSLPWWTYLRPIPAFAAFLVPLMFIVDLSNRPYFDAETQKVLHQIDILDFHAYYARSPASGFWILEYGKKFVGLIAIDASLDSTSDKTVVSNGNPSQVAAVQKETSKRGTSEVATIRHFYVMEEYRSTLMQEDLLHFAVQQTFSMDRKVKKIKAADSTLEPWGGAAMTKEGFTTEKQLGKMGILGWAIRSRVLTREKWAQIPDSQ